MSENMNHTDHIEEQQPTKLVKTAGDEKDAVQPKRRRRSDRYAEGAETPAEQKQAPEAVLDTVEKKNPEQELPAEEEEPEALPVYRRAAESKPTETESRSEEEKTKLQGIPVYLRKTGEPAGNQRMHEVPKGGAPGPAALQRNESRKSELRRPVNEPGYTERKPLGYAVPVEDRPARRPEVQEKKKKNRGLTIALVAVLLIGVIALALLLIPSDGDSVFSKVKSAIVTVVGGEKKTVTAEALDFEASPKTGSAPLQVAFSLTTNIATEDVRLVTYDHEEYELEQKTVSDNTNTRAWIMTVDYDEAFTGDVRAEVFDGKNWIDTGKSVTLQIAASPLETAVPTEEPTVPPTELPTLEITADMAVVITETPTMIPTDEPSPSPTGIPLAPLLDEDLTGEDTDPDEVVYDEADPDDDVQPDEDVWADDETVVEESVDLDDEPMDPVVTETPAPTEEPTTVPAVNVSGEDGETPTATPYPKVDISIQDSAKLITTSEIYNGNKKLSTYRRDISDLLDMPYAGEYTPRSYGVLTYRGDSFRQNAAEGNVGDGISGMSILWQYAAKETLKSSNNKTTYTGFGAGSQPVILQWSKEVRSISDMYDTAKETTALKEVIYAGENGRIYFLNLKDGTATRDAINIGYPMHATASIHPYGFPMMVVGQYAKKVSGVNNAKIGLRFVNLINGKQLSLIDGLDGNMKRYSYAVGSFENAPLIDADSDTMVAVGTNGLLYVTKINTDFNYNENTITVNPTSMVLKTAAKGEKDKYTSVESAAVSYQEYVWYADLGGILRCVNVNSLEVLWAVETGDAVYASLSLDMDEDGHLWLYTANTLSNRTKGDCQIRRYDAVTGEEDWTISLGMNSKIKKYTPGVMASPVIGENNLSGYAYFTVCGLSSAGAETLGLGSQALDGAVIAVRKDNGAIVWAKALDTYSVSSPVAVYSEGGKGWLVQGTSSGKLSLYDGATGTELKTLQLEGSINSSPAAYKNILVVGTQGSKSTSFIYGISLE